MSLRLCRILERAFEHQFADGPYTNGLDEYSGPVATQATCDTEICL